MKFSQHFKNLISGGLLFLTNIVVGLWLTPYLIKNLGIEVYAIYPLATTFTQYVALFTISLTSSISRFYIIDVQEKSLKKANITFSSSFFSLVAISVIIVPILIYFSLNVNSIFDISLSHIEDAKWTFALVLIGFVVSIFSSIFSVTAYAKNRVDLFNTINIIRNLSRALIILALFSFFKPDIKNVGTGYFLAAVLSVSVSILIFLKIKPQPRISFSHINLPKVKSIYQLSGWLIVNQIGYLLFLRIDIFFLNWITGIEASGQYAAIMQWSEIIRNFAGVFAAIFGPTLLIKYGQNKFENMFKITQNGMMYTALLLSFPIGIICGFSKELLSIWLGDNFSQYYWVLIFLTVHLGINSSATILNFFFKAYNKLKLPGIVTLIFGGLNAFGLFLVLKYTNYGLVGVAVTGGVLLTLKNGMFNPMYAAYLAKKPYYYFMKPLYGGSLNLVFVIAIAYTVNHFVVIENWTTLAFSSLIAVLLSLPFTYLLTGKKRTKELFQILSRKNG